MIYFDFHHHSKSKQGIYNQNFLESTPENHFSAGIHPKDITDDFEKQLEWLKKTSANPNCVAIGECGLDSLAETDDKTQEKAFEKQILWANEIRKPVIIHCVRRFGQVAYFSKISKVPMVIHGFNRNRQTAELLLDKGFYLSFGKALFYNLSLQQIFRTTDLGRIFLETDDSETDIMEIYRVAAEIKNVQMEEIAKKIHKNYRKITEL